MEAEYDSDCDYCDDVIEAGDSISHAGDSWGWVHGDCAVEIERADDEADMEYRDG